MDSLDSVDLTALNGRRIVLDPGHGGYFRGSLGVSGASEADVNLGVALELRNLLAAYGAEVHMTREASVDFFTPEDSTLRGDLAERVRLVNEWDPDLFVSIHHNADAGARHDVNETQTYYKMGDDGQSLDAGESIHRYLVRNLGITPHHIRPGNYFVLRNVDAPAVLTESSFITNPDVEERLVLPEKQRLEAEALLLGIGHFFGRGAPVIEQFVARASPGAIADTVFTDIAAPVFEGAVSGGFDEVRLSIDGAQIPHDVFGQIIESHSAPALPPGRHVASLNIRRTGSGAARSVRLPFKIERPPATMSIEAWPPSLNPGGAPVGIRAVVRDGFGFAYPGTLDVSIHIQGPGMTLNTVAALRDGVAWTHTAYPPIDSLRVWAEAHGLHSPVSTLKLSPEMAKTAWSGFSTGPGNAELLDALGTREPERRLRWINRHGFTVLPRDAQGSIRLPSFPGYRTWGLEREVNETEVLIERDGSAQTLISTPSWIGPLQWTAIAGGALHGKRITIDPDGGVDDPAGIGPSGTRGAHANIRVARILRAFLEAAGAEVLLTREGNDAVSDVERVRMSEAFGADRYLRIGHRAEAPRLAYYPGSSGGIAWAGRAASVMERLGLANPEVGDDEQYPLQQTSCPALYAGLARIDDAASEEALFEPGALRASAYALYVALAHEWAQDAAWAADSLEVRDDQGEPVAGAALWLGGSLMLETGASGRVRFMRTEPGPIEAAVNNSRVEASMILLDSTHGAVLTGPPGR